MLGVPSSTGPALWLVAALAASVTIGCGGQLDMASAHPQSQAATTVRYEGVAEAMRQFPDYSHIRSNILAPDSDAPPTAEPRAPARAR
jgi:hypothetical protein